MSDLSLLLEPPFARIVLDRPHRRNAMSEAMWRDMSRICEEIEGNAQILAVVVEGTGGHFCSGADIAEFETVFADPARARTYLAAIEKALEALSRLDRPTIAKVRGSAMGGGLALALACDLRFSSDDTQMAIPPAKLGLLYGPVETRLLVESVGPAAAKDLLFSARTICASEAVSLRLVNRSLPEAELDAAVEAYVLGLATLSQPSVRGAKKTVRAALASNMDELRSLVEAAAAGSDFREGRAAFREKRKPNFA